MISDDDRERLEEIERRWQAEDPHLARTSGVDAHEWRIRALTAVAIVGIVTGLVLLHLAIVAIAGIVLLGAWYWLRRGRRSNGHVGSGQG